jgi:hypothetical protein
MYSQNGVPGSVFFFNSAEVRFFLSQCKFRGIPRILEKISNGISEELLVLPEVDHKP